MAAVHAFLRPALEASVEEAKGTPFVDETGTIVVPPTTAELLMWFQAYQQQAATTITGLNNTISQLQAALNGKASASSLTDVRQRMLAAETTLLDKADVSFVTQQVQTITNIDSTQAAAITSLQQALTSEDGLVQGLLSTQTTQSNLLTSLRTDVDAKALASTVSTLSGRVTSLANVVNDPTAGLATKAAGTDVNNLAATVAGKANAADVSSLQATVSTNTANIASHTTALAGKALASDLVTTNSNLTSLATTVSGLPAVISQAKQDVKTELLGGAGAAFDTLQELATLELNTESLTQALTLRVGSVEGVVNNATTGIAALNTALAGKALATDLATTNSTVSTLTTTVASKALASDLATTNSNVAANTSAINLRATTAALSVQQGRIDNVLTTTVPALQADTALRLLRSGDTATGLIKGPDATVKTAYPTFQQTFGGVNSPRRTIQNITTGTTAMVALTDTTGQNRTILPIGIQFLLTGSVGLLSSVTVKLGTTAGGAELYTKTYSLLTGLLGKVTTIDQPVSATPLPAGQILYATITGGGQWTCFFDAVFLPTAS
jgi:hypothetical protein